VFQTAKESTTNWFNYIRRIAAGVDAVGGAWNTPRNMRLGAFRVLCWAVLLIPLLVFSSAAQDRPAVEIRVQNASDKAFDSVVVNFSGRQDYGRIASGEFSKYRTVGRAYRYARIQIKFGEETALLQPIDFVGESPLRAGRYPYRLTLHKRTDGSGYYVGRDFVAGR